MSLDGTPFDASPGENMAAIVVFRSTYQFLNARNAIANVFQRFIQEFARDRRGREWLCGCPM